ncbi:MAG: enoyl-CoA hydratase/isomerase family protein [Alphaproteobacteria bacterium]
MESEGTAPVCTIDGPRATIRLARPRQHNRIEPGDLIAIYDFLATVEDDPAVRVLVLTGTGGKTFSSGFHLGALSERQKSGEPRSDDGDNLFSTVVDRLEASRVPTIAALNGGVYGGSTDMALACDFRIGVNGMRMFMPAARLGLHYYESGLRRYATRLGLSTAKRLFLTAQPVDAAELLRMGFVDELVEPEDLAARVDALAAILAANAPLAVQGMKHALNAIAAGTADSSKIDSARRSCAQSEDIKEGLAAWAEKRAPVFRGR